MSISKTQALLDAHLQTVVGLPPLQLENIRLTVDGSPWCRATLLPAQSFVISLGVGASKKMAGLYQVDVMYPQDDGSSPARNMADLIVDSFSIGTRLTDGDTTVIIDIASAMTAQSLVDYYYVPVQIQWTVFT
jgi:hypothetical protein